MALLKNLLCVVLVCAMLAGFGSAFAVETLKVVCTSFPCYDFVRAVAGDAADVQMLIKPGAEVHSYEPAPADIIAIAECDLFVYVGGESDAWAVDILESFGKDAPRTLRFFDCIDSLEHAEHKHDSHDEMEYDEHIWTSPVNASAMVEALAAALCETEPAFAEAFLANADAYRAEIDALHVRFQEIVNAGVRREMVFADRFPFLYFAREYGIEWQAAFDSCSSESEPSTKTMMSLIDRIIRDGVPVVYTIELSNQKTAKTISDETGAAICTFHSVQNVTETDFAAGESYVSLMYKNADALEKGLN